MTVLVVAEKPSVGRDLAHVLGARTRGDGHFRGAGYVVTWAIGHLVALAEPGDMNAAWRKWRLHDLPMLPAAWPLVAGEGTRDQFDVVRALLLAKEVRGIVCATDAGREGELIFRYIYEAAGASKPVKRLWISSLTPEAIAAGFRTLQDGRAFDRLGDAARARSRADWLVGMNLSRLYSVLHDDNLSVGRVQTPTLALIVARELEIRAFVPEDYLEAVATFAPRTDEAQGSYEGTYVRAAGRDPRRLPFDGKDAAEIIRRAKTGVARIESVDRQSRRLSPPLLYDLTELQRHANRLYGFTAERTLQIAQNLYERRKLLSYPRTDSRHVSRAIEVTLAEIVEAVAPPYRALLAEGTGSRPLGPRFVDDAQVSDHHAIIPTAERPPPDLSPDERKIYELVCRRLLAAWHAEHVYAVTNVVTVVAWNDTRDRYASSGTSIESAGWKVLDVQLRATTTPPPGDERTLPGGLTVGEPRRVADAKAISKRTRPPARFTDGTLLTAMETAGRALEEKELSQAMRECGLGTPATRAAILETLLRRGYIVRDDRVLPATDKGIALIAMVHPHVKSPAMTGEWEAKLARIERGDYPLDTFMQEIERYVREVVATVAASSPSPSRSSSSSTKSSAPAPPPRTPRPTDLATLLSTFFGFPSFRTYQEDVCRAAAAGKDVLLVMPTGAGKSLCYQLPGIARGGTTLVVSPLIALMEDQVAQLVRRGFAAERIHSGRNRAQSREASKAYLDGALDFLFIAPERLKVSGFPEMLARSKPTLIAIDEAHCISQWGHDFRPDYRMLGDRLPLLRPAPVIALTATATPAVQDDIVGELRLDMPERFIHGFRRTNIGVEVVERSRNDRAGVVRRLLQDLARRPAIVYTPTRKEAEQLAEELSPELRAAAYHAGLTSAVRDDVQSAFLGTKLDIIIATTAFGMGIDKADVRTVIHTALPATVEGYYQEIGRAGRDGAPSRAVLLCSFVDTKTHEYFLERDYPDGDLLASIHKAVGAQGTSLAELRTRTRVNVDVFDKALEKLWVHGGVQVDPDDTVRRSTGAWRTAYDRQRAHKREQVDRMLRFTETPSCRMLQLVAHFGDQNDDGVPCGLCDVCAPASCIAQTFRVPSALEVDAAERVIAALRDRDGRSVGQLHRDLFGDGSIDRRTLDHLLGALARASRVNIVADTFVKDGDTIKFHRVHLANGAGAAPGGAMRIVVVPERAGTRRGAKGGAGGGAKGTRRSKRPPRPKRPPRDTPAAHDSVMPRTRSDLAPLEDALRAWRTSEAKKRRVPAFRILTDRTLLGIVRLRPRDEAELLEVSGMGKTLVEKYGRALLGLVARPDSGGERR